MMADKEAVEFDKWFNSTYALLRKGREFDLKFDEELKRQMFLSWQARGKLAKNIEDSYFNLIEKLRKMGMMD